MRGIDNLALVLAVIGGLNWGLVGAVQYNLVAAVFGGSDTLATRLIYAAIGLGSLWSLRFLAMVCRPRSAYLDESPASTERVPTNAGRV